MLKLSRILLAAALPAVISGNAADRPVSLMHEMRETPCPEPGLTVTGRAVSFQWPLASDCRYMTAPAKSATYKVRFSADSLMERDVTEKDTKWPFYNPGPMAPGKYFWQHAYVGADGNAAWSPVFSFEVDSTEKFCPPSYGEMITKLPAEHPRVYADGSQLSKIRSRAGSPDAEAIISRADKALKAPKKSPDDIKVDMAKGLKTKSAISQMKTRESRRIIDREEQAVDVLMKAYLLTGDDKYASEAVKRVNAMLTWVNHPNVVGDFNAATFMNVFSMAYDLLNDQFTDAEKEKLMSAIGESGSKMYKHYSNHLENHIADNHVWQMTLRIFSLGAFTAYGHIPEAKEWTEYAYNVWLARFPGLNSDGAWHNGDSYCNVNIRTLIEVPYFYSRVSGYDFFSDPWYTNNVMYRVYNQPPFSHTGGNGSAHLEKNSPSGATIGYLDALAKLTGNSYAADYVRRSTAKQPKIMQKDAVAKASGLAWWRLQNDLPLPEGPGIENLPTGYVFPESGLAFFSNKLGKPQNNNMLSFRSSPYGSTSHALANQNAFNTFFGGDPIFYSSGHHTSFCDRHAMYCERGTRAHNTILVDGIGQRIGVEGYGWIPRHYVGNRLGYVLGDASTAYGPVVSEKWIERAKNADVPLDEEHGFGEVGLKTFRRHVARLGETGLVFIYDELEADQPCEWSYLLHTVTNPMEVDETNKNYVKISGKGKKGMSDAFLFSSLPMTCDTTDRFFVPADNWLKADADGNFAKEPNHWHFTAKTPKSTVCRLATIINTHRLPKEGQKFPQPNVRKDGSIKFGEWIITANLSADGSPSFSVRSSKEGEDAEIKYDGGPTVITEHGDTYEMEDVMPNLEI